MTIKESVEQDVPSIRSSSSSFSPKKKINLPVTSLVGVLVIRNFRLVVLITGFRQVVVMGLRLVVVMGF